MPEYKKEFDAYLSFPATNEIDEASTVAEVVYEAATDGKDKLRYVVGKYANSVYNLKSASNLNGNLNCSKELEHYAS